MLSSCTTAMAGACGIAYASRVCLVTRCHTPFSSSRTWCRPLWALVADLVSCQPFHIAMSLALLSFGENSIYLGSDVFWPSRLSGVNTVVQIPLLSRTGFWAENTKYRCACPLNRHNVCVCWRWCLWHQRVNIKHKTRCF